MIRFEHLSKTFQTKDGAFEALKDVSFEIEKGDIYGVIGYSGAGKSTLIRMVNALERPTSGKIFVEDKDIGSLSAKELRSLRKGIGMIFQQFNLLESKTIYDNVAIALKLNGTPKKDIETRVNELLEFVELSDKKSYYPGQLSGGQKQRVGIARALANNPSILLCDEATSALDPKTTDSILNLLKKINETLHITIVIITHEMNVIQKICNKVAGLCHSGFLRPAVRYRQTVCRQSHPRRYSGTARREHPPGNAEQPPAPHQAGKYRQHRAASLGYQPAV